MGKIYLESFVLPIQKENDIYKNVERQMGGYVDNEYPCGIFSKKQFARLDFSPITILYGGNGSGKSTLLNLIAEKLELNRIAPFNGSETFNTYTKCCKYQMGFDDEGFRYRIPNGSRIISSDEIFDYMLTARTSNEELHEEKEELKSDYGEIKYGKTVYLRSMEDYENFRLQVLARKKSLTRRKFLSKIIGENVHLHSNGETALSYFNERLNNDTLYCLDEPENSLSPTLQLHLVEILQSLARYCGVQLIIATHSPFLLAIENAKIYNLDETPVSVNKWWELPNVKVYYEFFKQHENKFQ